MNQPLPIGAVVSLARANLNEAIARIKAVKPRLLLAGNREAAQDALEYIDYALTALADVDDESQQSLVN